MVVSVAGTETQPCPYVLLDELFAFWREGAGEGNGAKKKVTRNYVRVEIIGIYRDLFDLSAEAREDPTMVSISNRLRLRLHLSDETARRFRAQITELVKNAYVDLDHMVARTRLFDFASQVLTAEDTKALEALDDHAVRFEVGSVERGIIIDAIAKIEQE